MAEQTYIAVGIVIHVSLLFVVFSIAWWWVVSMMAKRSGNKELRNDATERILTLSAFLPVLSIVALLWLADSASKTARSSEIERAMESRPIAVLSESSMPSNGIVKIVFGTHTNVFIRVGD